MEHVANVKLGSSPRGGCLCIERAFPVEQKTQGDELDIAAGDNAVCEGKTGKEKRDWGGKLFRGIWWRLREARRRARLGRFFSRFFFLSFFSQTFSPFLSTSTLTKKN